METSLDHFRVKYSLPCLGVWLVYWLAYFPGLADADALITQWRQITLGYFWDGFTSVYTLIDWVITRVWFSPAAITLAQVLALSAIVGWGLAKFARIGVPGRLLWLVCWLLALSPVMGMVSIIAWKDVPYGIGILWLTLLIMEVVATRGRWLATSRLNVVWLAMALSLVALIRHEGIALAILVLLLLGAAYRRHWKRLVAASLILGALYAAMLGPIYDLAHVSRVTVTPGVVVHQVGALVAAGTPLSSQEKETLGKILPLEEWKTLYFPWDDNSLIYSPDFRLADFPAADDEASKKLIGDLLRVWASLVRKNPAAALENMVRGGEIVWRVSQDRPWYTVPSSFPENDVGLRPQSQWPEMRELLDRVVAATQTRYLNWIFWRPALFLYLILALTVATAVRTRYALWLLYAAPAVLQATSVFLLLHQQYFRYLFGVYLVGMFSLCLLWLIVRGSDGATGEDKASVPDGVSPVLQGSRG